MTPISLTQMIGFLQEELSLPTSAIALALRQRENDPGPLPMILWKYGLITIEQMTRIYDWLEQA